jgi:hypothetical protein
MADIIHRQQGYLKSVADVKVSLNYLHRSFVPRKNLSNPMLFKKANKFLQSIKNYTEKIFSLPPTSVKYKNISDAYTFLDDYNAKRVSLKETLEINDPEGLIRSSYKKKFVEDLALEGDYSKQLDIRRRVVAGMTKGIKSVDKNIYIRPVLKKKYKTHEDMVSDLYSIYLGWFDSKSKSRDLYIDIKSIAMDYACYMGNYPTNKVWRKNFITKAVFKEYLVCDYSKIPKRFWRIMKFCRSTMKGKSTPLDTVSESIYTQIVVKDENKEANVFKKKRLHDIYRYTLNPKFRTWANFLARDLTKRGFFRNPSHAFDMDFTAKNNLKYHKPKVNRQYNKMKAILTVRIARDFLGRFLDIIALDDLESMLNTLGSKPLLNPTFESLISVLSYVGLTKSLTEIERASEKALKELGTQIKKREWSFKADTIFAQKLQKHALSLGYLTKRDIFLEEDAGILPLDYKTQIDQILLMETLPFRTLIVEKSARSIDFDQKISLMHSAVNHYITCYKCKKGNCGQITHNIKECIPPEDRKKLKKIELVEEIETYLSSKD